MRLEGLITTVRYHTGFVDDDINSLVVLWILHSVLSLAVEDRVRFTEGHYPVIVGLIRSESVAIQV